MQECGREILARIPEAGRDAGVFAKFMGACVAHRFEVSAQSAEIRMENAGIRYSPGG